MWNLIMTFLKIFHTEYTFTLITFRPLNDEYVEFIYRKIHTLNDFQLIFLILKDCNFNIDV